MNRIIILYKILVITCFLFVSCSSDNEIPDPVNDIYLSIPDTRFETILINTGIDTDGVVNQQMLKKDAEKVNTLNLNFVSKEKGEISNLTGIEGFRNLKKLSAVQNSLTNIDLSANSLLDTIYLMGNYITSIDLSNNPNLILVDLDANELSSISGLSKATHLKTLRLSFNLLEEFSIHNESIEALFISDNLLKSFDVSGAVNLKNILLKTNKISSLDLSSNTLLETLVLSDNKIQNIKLEQNSHLTHLFISSNLLTNLDVSNLQELVRLIVDKNPDLSCIKIRNGQNIPMVSKSDYQELNSVCN